MYKNTLSIYLLLIICILINPTNLTSFTWKEYGNNSSPQLVKSTITPKCTFINNRNDSVALTSVKLPYKSNNCKAVLFHVDYLEVSF